MEAASEETNTEETSVPEKEPEVAGITRVSAYSLAGLRAKKELEQQQNQRVHEARNVPVEDFSDTDMLIQWNKYAQRMGDKGEKIMESLMLMNVPRVDGHVVIHELPNESSRIDFESQQHDLLAFLRAKLHNHEIQMRLLVNETLDTKMAFTPQDRYNRLNQINPALEMLKRTFDLDF